MMKFKLWKAVACLAVLVAGAGRGEAAPVSVADLLVPGATLVSGDKTFYNFHNFTETPGMELGAANIYLTAISQPNRNLTDPGNWPLPSGQPACPVPCPTEYGFRLFGDFDVLRNQQYNLGLDFSVMTTNPLCHMYASELELTANATNGEVDASTNITSGPLTVANNGTFVHNTISDTTLDRHYFYNNQTGDPICVDLVHVSLGLQLKAADVFGAQASAEHVDFYLAQSGVPEPSTYALLVLGSAGVGLMVRRKRS